MRAAFAALLVLVATLILGMWIGGHGTWLPGPLRDFTRGEQASRIDAALKEIQDDYYREVGEEELADDAVRGMIRGLDDRFSAYFDAGEYAKFRELSEARFSGVGLGVQGVEDGLRVVQVYDRSPAEKAGLRIGDIIVKAGDTRLAGRPEESATGLIKGRPGTQVSLTVKRKDRTFTRRLTRAQIAIPVVSSRRRSRAGKDYAVIRLETFSPGAHAEVYAAVRKALDRKVDGIVFDLRGNGGGLVEEARLVASTFLADGKIVTTRGRTVPERTYRATGKPVAPDTPLVVLVDKGTASAAEIVAGALQDRDRAELVGTSTFGKGVFQEIDDLPGGGALDLTVGQYFLPSGRNIGGRGAARGAGLKPDTRAQDDPDTRREDEGLDGALAALGSSSAS